MPDLEKVKEGLTAHGYNDCKYCPYWGTGSNGMSDCKQLARDALALLKEQEPRVMNVTEVTASEVGAVLWVEERQGVTWNLFLLEIETNSIHPDTGTAYLFFITYHGLKKFECDEYNQVWRCWTSRPSDEQREATPWQ